MSDTPPPRPAGSNTTQTDSAGSDSTQPDPAVSDTTQPRPAAPNRSPPPPPHPTDFQPDGSLWGDVPLDIPRPRVHSARGRIIERKDGVTTYRLFRNDGQGTLDFEIDTRNERILLGGLSLML